ILAGSCLVYFNSRSYWETRKRVQTVDFHILFHQLPYKLSALKISKNTKEIQRLINSSNGFFGIVVTNCKTSNSRCPGEKVLYSTNPKTRWNLPNLNELSKHPYDLLKDPPPILTEQVFKDPRSESPISTKQVNSGKIIGRVYYIRGIYNNPLEDIQWWFENGLFIDSGAARPLLASMLISLMLGISIVLGIEIAILIRKRSEERIKQVTSELNLAIDRETSKADENRNLSRRLEDTTCQLQEAQRQIQYLQRLDPENQSLKEANQQLSEVLENVESEKNYLMEKAFQWDYFSEELKGIPPKEALAKMNAYDEIQQEKRADNQFEQKILDYLNGNQLITDKKWVVSSGIDLGKGLQPRAQTDIIISTEKFIVILEAKNCKGKITAQSPRNGSWYCNTYKINKERNISPYNQICSYANRAMQRLKEYHLSTDDIPILGLVIFPEGADIDDLSGQLGRRYDVTTLEKLIDKVVDFGKQFNKKTASNYSADQLDRILKGQRLPNDSLCKPHTVIPNNIITQNLLLESSKAEGNGQLSEKSSAPLIQNKKNQSLSEESNISDSNLKEKDLELQIQNFIIKGTDCFKANNLEDWRQTIRSAKHQGIDNKKINEKVMDILQFSPFQDSIHFKVVAAKELQVQQILNELIEEIGLRQKKILNIQLRCNCIEQYLTLVTDFANENQKKQAVQRCNDWIKLSPELINIQEQLIIFLLKQSSKAQISSLLKKCHGLLNSSQPLSRAECKALFFMIQYLEDVSQACQLIKLTLYRATEFREISGIWQQYVELVNRKGGKESKRKLHNFINSPS
ncbi:MAG: NERD domain-containing protein, partial [Thermosynechococcaceae cyanobacterium]